MEAAALILAGAVLLVVGNLMAFPAGLGLILVGGLALGFGIGQAAGR